MDMKLLRRRWVVVGVAGFLSLGTLWIQAAREGNGQEEPPPGQPDSAGMPHGYYDQYGNWITVERGPNSHAGYSDWPHTYEKPGPYLSAMEGIKSAIEKSKQANLMNMILWKHIDKMEEDIRKVAKLLTEKQGITNLMDLVAQGKGTFQYQPADPTGLNEHYPEDILIDDDEEAKKIQDALNKEAPYTGKVLDPIRFEGDEDVDVQYEFDVSKKKFGTYVSVQGHQILVPEVLTEEIKWMPSVEQASWNMRLENLVHRVSQEYRASLEQSGLLSEIVGEMAQVLLPGKLLKEFDPRRAVAWLLSREGVAPIADGIVSRPSVPQDAFYRRYANLNSSMEGSVLFWSDPMVLNGYDPALGTALNQTPLRGYRTVDMDNVASRGKSASIDIWNRLQPRERRYRNPYLGLASKTIPGLMILGREGRLIPGEPPTEEQMQEARKLSQTVEWLPSQTKLAKKTGYSDFQKGISKNSDSRSMRSVFSSGKARCKSGIENEIPDTASNDARGKKRPYGREISIFRSSQNTFSCLKTSGWRFVYPRKIQTASTLTSDTTKTVWLPTYEREAYRSSMKMALGRLRSIQELIELHVETRTYVDSIIQKLQQIQSEAKSVAEVMKSKYKDQKYGQITGNGPSFDGSIAEVTQLRQAVIAHAERERAALSKLSHQLDDLKQKRWIILEHVIETRKKAVETLMNNGSIRLRLATARKL